MENDRFRARRERLVDAELSRDIVDGRVLDALRKVPRERFVPPDQRRHTYENRPLPLPHGQTISQPLMVGLMLQHAHFTGSEHVLEVGTGSGYQAALLAELAGSVVTVERLPDLAAGARSALAALGYSRVEVVVSDGSVGYPPRAPYDRILVAAGAPNVPDPLVNQLAPNGILMIPVGGDIEQSLLVLSKNDTGDLATRPEGRCAFVPLIGSAGWPPGQNAPSPTQENGR